MSNTASVDYRRLPRRIFLTLFGTGLIAVMAIIFVVIWMSNTTNRVAAENSTALFESALRGKADRVAVSVKDYGRWEEAYNWIKEEDHEAVDWNVGTGTTENSTFDLLFVVTPNGRPLYAYETDGASSDISIYHPIVSNELMDALAPLPIEPYPSQTAFAVVDGAVYLLSAGRVQPYDASGFDPGSLNVMIGGLALTSTALAEMGSNVLIDVVELFDVDAPLKPGMIGLPLLDINGETIGQLAWQPPRPGDTLLWRSMPIVASLSVLLLLGSLSVGRASGLQTAKIIEEKENSRTDSLTGLMNRAGLEHLIGSDRIQMATQKGHLALLYLDLNGFKQLNDSLGHEAGDLALQITAKRIQSAVRQCDTVVRIGGDEFVCVIVDDDLSATAMSIADRITASTKAPLDLNGDRYAARPSIGVALAKRDMHWDTLLSNADAAMYRAKRHQQHSAVLYEEPENSKTAA